MRCRLPGAVTQLPVTPQRVRRAARAAAAGEIRRRHAAMLEAALHALGHHHRADAASDHGGRRGAGPVARRHSRAGRRGRARDPHSLHLQPRCLHRLRAAAGHGVGDDGLRPHPGGAVRRARNGGRGGDRARRPSARQAGPGGARLRRRLCRLAHRRHFRRGAAGGHDPGAAAGRALSRLARAAVVLHLRPLDGRRAERQGAAEGPRPPRRSA